MSIKLIGQTNVVVLHGDITKQDTEAIVNATNSRLAGGGGVDGAIHRAGGPDIMRECRAIGGCPTGEAVITTAGRLKAKKVIHAVGPIYKGAQQDKTLLTSCYRKSMELAIRHGLRSIAFPSISTGAYGYPIAEASAIAIKAIMSVIKEYPEAFEEVRFVVFSNEAFAVFDQELVKVV